MVIDLINGDNTKTVQYSVSDIDDLAAVGKRCIG